MHSRKKRNSYGPRKSCSINRRLFFWHKSFSPFDASAKLYMATMRLAFPYLRMVSLTNRVCRYLSNRPIRIKRFPPYDLSLGEITNPGRNSARRVPSIDGGPPSYRQHFHSPI